MKKTAVVIGVVLAVVSVVAIGLLIVGGLWMRAHGGYGPGMMAGWHGYPRGMHPLGGGLLILVLAGIFIGAIALLIVGLTRPKQKAAGVEPTPLEILKRRYASGEIDREEFERMKEEVLT
jgi:putative membrane protein